MNWLILSHSDPLSLCLTSENFMMSIGESRTGTGRRQNEPVPNHALDGDPFLRAEPRLAGGSPKSNNRTMPHLLAAGFRADLRAGPFCRRRPGSHPGFFHDVD